MENKSIWEELQDFFRMEYGMYSMSFTLEYDSEGVAEIEMQPSGLIKLMNDLIRLKASVGLVDDGVPEPPTEEIKCTFDEAMQFNS